uniref:Lysine decarboxylase n=1 Tax=Kwoniella dejecticola CBS 10117 TaxID=1296121 RepID=A0A1A6A757_9TREE|nr:lysine decarboxylase [Kwoniella dejecticola CBS 10117]OBR85891.1 lysine decarboxylase [Kwoniella dejecticola CBS 10117]
MSSSSPFPAQANLQKPVCVFCGSSPGKLPLYTNASAAVGQALAKANIPLVYGGGRRGIMGVVSQSCLQAGGYVHGIVPHALTERASEHTPAPGAVASSSSSSSLPTSISQSKEGQGEDVLVDNSNGSLTTDVVGSMHERKLKMARLSQGGFIVLPGGYGTFEEALEMITWNQLGIHRLPILILNIGNFYTHLYNQFLSSVEAGFITQTNLSLLRLVNLEGGESANADESRASEWGDAALKALREWSLASSAKSPEAIFTTLRYTSSSASLANTAHPIRQDSLPLLKLHFERLKEAFEHFSKRDGEGRWGIWPGEETIWQHLKSALEEKEKGGPGDYRASSLFIRLGGQVEVQCPDAPKDAGPFTFFPSSSRPTTRRPVILDPENTDIPSEGSKQVDLRLYKTTSREIYDTAYERGGKMISPDTHPEVLLHTNGNILETTTSNIAVQSPGSDIWITPKLDIHHPFLNGVMRRYLLAEGVIQEGEVTLEMLEQVKKEGGRLIGFNGLRGVWEGELL